MLIRLGRVVYWLACGCALSAFALGVAVSVMDGDYGAVALFAAVVAIVIVLGGAAVRYLLSGETLTASLGLRKRERETHEAQYLQAGEEDVLRLPDHRA